MTITARHRAAARRRRAQARTTVATRPVVPANRYSAPLQGLTQMRQR
jgi:hypothetical protein